MKSANAPVVRPVTLSLVSASAKPDTLAIAATKVCRLSQLLLRVLLSVNSKHDDVDLSGSSFI